MRRIPGRKPGTSRDEDGDSYCDLCDYYVGHNHVNADDDDYCDVCGILIDNIYIILKWGAEPEDLDSHLMYHSVSESGTSKAKKVDYINMACYDAGGALIADLDADNTAAYGSEKITVYRYHPDDTFWYYVGSGGNTASDMLAQSGATVEIYRGEMLLKRYSVPKDLKGYIWEVFRYRNGVIESLTHDYEITRVDATKCGEKGYLQYTCRNCGNQYRAYDDNPQAHAVVIDNAVLATCTEPGLTEGSHCERCGEILVPQGQVPPRGHSYGSPVFEWSETNSCSVTFTCTVCWASQNLPCEVTSQTIPPTEQEDGQTTYTAVVVFNEQTYRDTKVIVLPRQEHTVHIPGAEWYSDRISHWKQCTVCGEKTEEAPHLLGNVSPEDGYRSCGICGFVIRTPENLDWFFEKLEEEGNYLWASGHYIQSVEKYD